MSRPRFETKSPEFEAGVLRIQPRRSDVCLRCNLIAIITESN